MEFSGRRAPFTSSSCPDICLLGGQTDSLVSAMATPRSGSGQRSELWDDEPTTWFQSWQTLADLKTISVSAEGQMQNKSARAATAQRFRFTEQNEKKLQSDGYLWHIFPQFDKKPSVPFRWTLSPSVIPGKCFLLLCRWKKKSLFSFILGVPRSRTFLGSLPCAAPPS